MARWYLTRTTAALLLALALTACRADEPQKAPDPAPAAEQAPAPPPAAVAPVAERPEAVPPTPDAAPPTPEADQPTPDATESEPAESPHAEADTAEPGVEPLPDAGPLPETADARAAAVERWLLRPTEVAGDVTGEAIADRMKWHRVPGVGVAVINGGEVDWARGYGVQSTEDGRPVTADTMFQAASISKAVAAMVALVLVDEGTLALDEDVNAKLQSVQVPSSPFLSNEAPTLRRLLSHTARITHHGFLGYEVGVAIPTTTQIIQGSGPANTPAIDRSAFISGDYTYSGGGYMFVQQLIEDVTGKPFADVAREKVFQPLGMAHSTYEQPLPEPLTATAASAHDERMGMREGRWFVLPEAAPAGLWTTAHDLAVFLVAVLRAARGEPGSLISKALAEDMLSREAKSPVGLGLFITGEGSAQRFGHDGANPGGYLTSMFAFRSTGQGAVVLTNSNRGYKLIREVLRGISTVYDWPSDEYHPRVRRSVAVAAEVLERYEGTYQIGTSPDERIVVTRVNGHLRGSLSGGLLDIDLRPFSAESFFVLDSMSGNEIVFEGAGPGPATKLSIIAGERGRREATRIAVDGPADPESK